MGQNFIVQKKIRLKDFDPSWTGGMEKEVVARETAEALAKIGKMQPMMTAGGRRGILVVLQGMDASGKDGASRSLLVDVNPAGVQYTAFKVPSAEERAHDFLWRCHQAVPRLGNIGVWNRSHYEDVLVVRVLNLVPREVWRKRYDQINDFERILTENGYAILKFFLHISKKEQAVRLQERLDDETRRWKFAMGDLKMREHWDEFQEAYEEAINLCSTEHAPWHIVPADRKWVRDRLISQRVLEVMQEMKLKWPEPSEDLTKARILP